MKRRTFAMATLACCLATMAHAQSDTTPLRLVVPFPPGDALDSTARAVAESASAALGRPIIVENRAGASGAIAADAVARSDDGTTFLLGTAAMMTVTPYVRKTPYSPSDFTPVGRIATISLVFSVPGDFPAKTWEEFTTLARQNPGKYTYASPGDGTIIHMSMEMLQKAAGIQLLHIPYKGMAPALQDFLGKRVDVYAEPAIITHIQAGTAQGLAVMAEQRLASIPDIPTLAELGTSFDAEAWLGVFAPRSTSPELVTSMASALQKALAQPALQGKLPPGVRLAPLAPAAFGAQIEAEQTAYRQLITDLNLKLD